MGSFGIYHWLIVLLVVVLIFGTKKLRNIGGDLGGALRDFKKGLNGGEETPPSQLKADPPPDSVAPVSDTKRDNAQ